MSRYADRLAPPSTSNRRHEQQLGGGQWRERGYGGRHEEEDEDDETAIATDLSMTQPRPRRSVAFGDNTTEEFNGSEAPDAIRPVSSLSHRHPPPLPPPLPQQQQQQQGIGRPRSTSMSERRPSFMGPPPLPPPPPPPDYRYQSSGYHDRRPHPPPLPPSRAPPSFRPRSPEPTYHRPVSFARGGGYEDEEDDRGREGDEYYDSDDEDAFTAVGTGVATDLDLDYPAPFPPSTSRDGYRDRYDSRSPYEDYPRAQQHDNYLSTLRPPSRGAPANRPPLTHRPQQSYSPSGYPTSDLSLDGESDSSYDHQQGNDRQRQQMAPPPLPSSSSSSRRGSLAVPAPPRGLSRPSSTGSMCMLMDEHGEGGLSPPLSSSRRSGGGAIGRQGTPQARALVVRQPSPMRNDEVRSPPPSGPPEDSPVEKALIASLKELRFSIALKDLHDTLKIGVQKTLVAEDGLGNAYCKVHCKKLPQQKDLVKEAHLAQHWVSLGSSRWEFRTASHRVTVVFKTEALAVYESQFLTARR